MSSILPADNDLAAELILNKMMNGQIKSASGRTVTSGNRLLAQDLNATAYETSLVVGTVKGAQGYVLAAQSQTSAMLENFKKMETLLIDAKILTDDADIVKIGLQVQDLMNEISQTTGVITTGMIKATINGKDLFGATDDPINAGLGSTINILGLKPTFNAEYNATTQSMGNLISATGLITDVEGKTAKITTAGSAADALTAIQQAMKGLTNNLASYAQQFQALEDRATLLNDLGAGFTASANAQTTTASTGATGLLNSVLGTTTA